MATEPEELDDSIPIKVTLARIENFDIARMLTRGWELVEGAGLRSQPWVKRLEKRKADSLIRHEPGVMGGVWSLVDGDGIVRRQWAPLSRVPYWIDYDNNGRIVYADKGFLWAWSGFPEGKPKMIADLNKNEFETIQALEWALEW